MADYLDYRGYKYLQLDGGTSGDDRAEMLKVFNAPDSEYFVFLMTTKAGGVGLNLQTADTVILFDSDWNPQNDLQAQARAHRIGQKHAVRVLRLVTTSPIEQGILDAANQKLDLDNKIIQAGGFNNQRTDNERREELKKLIKTELQSVEVMKVPDAEEINFLIARSEGEEELFNKMDKEIESKRLKEWKEEGNPADTFPDRLMQEEELDESLLVQERDLAQQEMSRMMDYGRGQRDRKDVMYDDGLSDDQFASMVDSGKDLGEIEKIARKAKGMEVEDDEDEDDDDEEKQRGRKRGRNGSAKAKGVEKGKKKQAVLPGDDPKWESVLDEVLETMDAREQKKFQSKLQRGLQRMIDAMMEEEEDGRTLCDAFIDLVDEKIFSDYYATIERPISLSMIQERMEDGVYGHPDQLMEDVDLMVSNAEQYNVEGSRIVQDAYRLRGVAAGVGRDLKNEMGLGERVKRRKME
eukprot:TRINITY_DN1471_c0_g1_i4.p2 TRINITY_DN1471_c0_g1~~TRINITY_DN1471_c0_g1_i4.p2  ORF type:complete len:466 (-),score=199.36 TRINITY_DN1471_c0_g1_i4:136-1533(-)